MYSMCREYRRVDPFACVELVCRHVNDGTVKHRMNFHLIVRAAIKNKSSSISVEVTWGSLSGNNSVIIVKSMPKLKLWWWINHEVFNCLNTKIGSSCPLPPPHFRLWLHHNRFYNCSEGVYLWFYFSLNPYFYRNDSQRLFLQIHRSSRHHQLQVSPTRVHELVLPSL